MRASLGRVALSLLLAFTAVMSWSRQNLILLTGNRIDAILGNRIFEQLLALPARYFESRPTGTLVDDEDFRPEAACDHAV